MKIDSLCHQVNVLINVLIMFLTVPPNQRAGMALQLEKVKRDIREQTFSKRIDTYTNEQENKEFLKPLIDVTKQNTQVLQKLLPDVTERQKSTHNVITRDPLFRTSNGKTYFGDHEIMDMADHIMVNDTKFEKTPGLMDLIGNKNPVGYTEDDVLNYKNFLKVTDWPYTKNKKLKSISDKNGNPKKVIQKNLIDELRNSGQGLSRDIIYLPSDIKDIIRRLNLCLGEFEAGNQTTRNEIISLLDLLKQRKGITRHEYNRINAFLYESL